MSKRIAKSLKKGLKKGLRKESWSKLSWRAYATLLEVVAGLTRNFRPVDAQYDLLGLKTGCLEPSLATLLECCFDDSSSRPVTVEDYAEGYLHNPHVREIEDRLNSSLLYIDIEDRHLGVIANVCSQLSVEIKHCLGTGWKVVNTRAWESHLTSDEVGSNVWHTDGFAKGLYKILIYLNEVGKQFGTTEIELHNGQIFSVEGPPGTFVFFNSSDFIHRGVPPRTGTRPVIELTVMPALWNDCRPIFAGQNALYPRFPWGRRSIKS